MEFRIIALDMDGTLLDAAGQVPDSFWPVLEELRARGVAVAPASGRQLATLQAIFPGDTYIAENGTCVFHDGEVVSTTLIDTPTVTAVIDAAADMDLVVCTPTVAYHRPGISAETEKELAKYYHSRQATEDLHSVTDVIKLAVFTPGDAETEIYPLLLDAAPDANVVVSGAHWIDIMHADAGKGRALTALAEAMGVDKQQTAAFGDYLNDLELLEAAGTAWAMENAHPDILAIADHIAPPNTEEGVVTVLRSLLD
ncbi:MAG: HAD family hydrolase [Corynebacterium sp.]|uniref:HAD family hydrolase n=1 Tax=Corynebacterium sp. TaxID=1720 RepID=UPI0026E055B8|nr:HAD family hydrolase [Corynebacterium sp.]MDO5671001.1 HAD family hydrolase [Corynebacterium sp.]